MITFFREIRYALRLILRNKGFSLAVLLSTALGVGATASIFSLVDAFLLRPLPVPGTGRVVRLTSVNQSNPVGRFSYAEIDDIKRQTRSFEGLATSKNAAFGYSQQRDQQPRVTVGVLVNGDYFSTLRVTPAIGRTFTAVDDQVPGRGPVVVLSYSVWQREFGGRPDVIGQSLRLNASEFVIVGVTPQWFTGVHPFFEPTLYVPRMMIREATGSDDALTDRNARSVDVFARLKTGVSIEQARDDVRRAAVNMEREHPAANKGRGAMVFTQLGYRIAEAPDNFTLSWLFFAVAALVLSIACVNVANLLLSTAPARVREIAVRMALGASRTRLLGQFLIESAVLSTLGAIIGLGIAAVSASFIRSIQIATDFPVKLDARVDLRVALFALAVGLMSGLFAGVLPAVRATRADLNAVLKATEHRFAASRGWMRQALVAAQVAVALVMMVLSGLFLQTIRVSRTSDPGFRTEHVLTMGFDPRIAGYDVDATRTFYRRLLARMETVPGVRNAALGEHVPLGVASSATEISIAGYDVGPNQQTLSVGSSIVDDRYFDVLGIPIVRGRAFTSRDRDGAPPVAIVNETMARKYWPTRDAIGATITIRSAPVVTAEIVGIARNSKKSRRRRTAAALSLPAVRAAAADAHDAVRARGRRSRRARRRGARAGARARSESANLRRAHDGRAFRTAGTVGRASCRRGHLRGRRRRPRAQRPRSLRGHRVLGQPAHPGDRHPHGDRRERTPRPRHGAGAGLRAQRHRHHGRVAADAGAEHGDRGSAQRREPARTGRLRSRDGCAAVGDARRDVPARAPCIARRSAGGAAR